MPSAMAPVIVPAEELVVTVANPTVWLTEVVVE